MEKQNIKKITFPFSIHPHLVHITESLLCVYMTAHEHKFQRVCCICIVKSNETCKHSENTYSTLNTDPSLTYYSRAIKTHKTCLKNAAF